MRRVLLVLAGLGLALTGQELGLQKRWQVRSSAQVAAAPSAIASAGFDATGWYAATVPSTVFNTLVENKVVADPDYGMNLRQADGVTYKIGANFSHEEIADSSPYRVPWWFRTEFTLPAAFAGKKVWLQFKGINYRANVWLNGKPVATSEQVQGTFRRFVFEVSAAALPGQTNALAVEVFPPGIHDLALTFVDWNPMPPDKDMGVWGAVSLRASGPVALSQPFVATHLETTGAARLEPSAVVTNATAAAQSGTLVATLGARVERQSVRLAAGETREVRLPPLVEAHPQLWWPYGMGTPVMRHASFRFVQAETVSDRAELDYGVSEITAGKTAEGGEQFLINGRKLMIRGGGWTPDMLLRDGPARWADDFAYVKDMNLNTVRLEGKLVDDEFFNLADRAGILVMAGWCCCDHWEEWSGWKDDERTVATRSLADQIDRLRTHPSLLVWLNGSDNPPPAEIEQAYLEVLRTARWPKPVLSSASAKKTTVTGASGVKMTGPYDYVPPVYWLAQTASGGALGFNTETSPGAAIPPIESLRKFIPAEHLWPQDEYWNYHAGGGQFLNLDRYNAALAARYGAARDLNDYVWKAQAMSYEAERAMFEGFGRNQGRATGVIQWMLNNGWPSLIWHLYDYYLRPGAGYFAAKVANEPLHAQYADFDHDVVVVNNRSQAQNGVRVSARVYSLQGKLLSTQTAMVDAAATAATVAFALTKPEAITGDYFLRVTAAQGAATVSSNFYWLSSQPDVMDTKAGTWFTMPQTSYADFRGLEDLPPAHVTASANFSRVGDEGVARVRVSNTTAAVAFFNRLRVLRGAGGEEVLPVRWSDNYITLMPGESTILSARYRWSDLEGAAPVLAVGGWTDR